MAKEMLINVSAGEECRIALLEDGKLEELYMERNSATSHVGNIYKGKVTNVEPSIQAAFVDFGIGRNGFLHISDLMPQYFGKKGGDYTEPVGQKLSRRDRPPIQQCLRKGDEIIVQIIKEGIGTKGPTLTTYLSVPGRVLVMMPGMSKMGISKKIEDEVERARLRKILDGLKPPKDCGFIIRTAGIGKSKLEIERDLKYLARLWETLKKKIDKDKPPVELYTEGDLVTRTVRDVFTTDVDQIIVDDKETAKKIKDFIKLAMPRTKNKVTEYKDGVPLFHKYEIEDHIEQMYSHRVPLPSGGSLIIDQTEAIVAIDVNSGKFRDHSDAETTAFKTDLEAADEIPRQLRLRDMGGVIICDFIDLRFERHRRELEQRLFENLKKDRAKTRMLRMSQFGIIEMTRQRMRPSLKKSIYSECSHCAGHGMVKTPESMALDLMRKIRIGLNDGAVQSVKLAVHPEVATFLLNKKRYEMAKLEQDTEKKITVTPDPTLALDESKFELYDSRDGYVYIADLGMTLPTVHQQRQQIGQGREEERGRRSRGRGDRDRDRNQGRKAKHDRGHEDTEALDADDLFSEDDAQAAQPKPAKGGRAAKAAKGDDAEKDEKSAVAETGSDDEATVVDIDDGGDGAPGEAAAGFFDENDRGFRHQRRDNNRRGGGGGSGQRGGRDNRRNDDNRGGENRGGDNRPAENRGGENRGGDNRRGDNRGSDNRNRDNRGADNRGGDNRGGGRNQERDRDRGRDGGRNDQQPRQDRGPRPQSQPIETQREGDEPHDEGELAEAGAQGEGGEDQYDRQDNFGGGGGGGGQQGGGQFQGEGEGGGRRRRRRRRGRRGRGRGQNGEFQDQGNGGNQQGGVNQGHNLPTPQDRDEGGVDSADDIHDEPIPAHVSHEMTRTAAEAEGAGGRRGGRGGRRGGRGRGRGGDPKKGGKQPQRTKIEGLPDDEELDREAAELEARLARERAAAGGGDDVEETPAKAEPAPRAAGGNARQRASSTRTPPPMPEVVKTGSVDKHLADDEPVAHDPKAPPISFNDLDELPDYDDE